MFWNGLPEDTRSARIKMDTAAAATLEAIGRAMGFVVAERNNEDLCCMCNENGFQFGKIWETLILGSKLVLIGIEGK